MLKKRVAVLMACLALAPGAVSSGCGTVQTAGIVQHVPAGIEASYYALGTAYATARQVKIAGGMDAGKYATTIRSLDMAADLIKRAEGLTGSARQSLLAEANAKIGEVQ